jgi:quercetin dioxygenase-like cupin family protein
MRCAVAIAACLFLSNVQAQDMGVVRKMSENKFVAVPGLPACVTSAVQSGDPSKGASILLFKGRAGCRVPWHWHTPTEQVMIVSGSAVFDMKDHKGPLMLGPGGYARMPSKHIHQFTCTSACSGFVSSDAAFDIHYVDAAGKEITPEAALAKKK